MYLKSKYQINMTTWEQLDGWNVYIDKLCRLFTSKIKRYCKKILVNVGTVPVH